MLDERFVILAAALNFFGAMNYLVSTLKGRTKPNRVTWFLWAAAPMLAFSAALKQGVGLSSLMTFMVGFNPFLIFLASFVNKKSRWNISRLDITCGVLSVLGLILWQLTQTPNLAILFAIIADGLAAIPTIIKSYSKPETENYKVFLFAALSAGITLTTVKALDFAHTAFPIYILLICLVLFILIKFKLGTKIQKLIK